jgi:Trypsin
MLRFSLHESKGYLVAFVLAASFSIISLEPAEAQFATRQRSLPSAAAAPVDSAPIVEDTSRSQDNEVLGGTFSRNRKIVGLWVEWPGGRGYGICSGLWIAANIVLTAGHCLCNEGASVVSIYLHNGDRLPNIVDGSRAMIKATGSRKHPAFECWQQRPGFDLALVYLRHAELPVGTANPGGSAKKTLLPQDKKQICPNYSLLSEIRTVETWRRIGLRRITVAGYGYSNNPNEPIRLRNAAMLSLDSLECETAFHAQALRCIRGREFIAGSSHSDVGRRDSCEGDSGGPAFIEFGDTFIPVGIVSRGLPINAPFHPGNCGAGGIYIHLGHPEVLRWLEENGVPMGKSSC